MPLWFYRRLLALYPAEFRREYGAGMREQFREDWSEARHRGGMAAIVFWFRLARDWMTSVTAAHAEIAGQDLAAAQSSLRRRPLSSAALVMLLALAIAGNTVLLVIADRLLLHPLPFEAQGPLVFLAQSRPDKNIGWQTIPWSLADRLKRSARALADVAFFSDFSTDVDGFSRHVYSTAAGTFKNLDLHAAAGRLFTDGETDVAVLGPRFWNQRYGRYPSAIGSSIRVLGRDYLVIGALREQPPFPFDADIWVSLPSTPFMGAVFARLKPGASLRDAQAEWLEIRNHADGSWPAELAWLRSSWRAPAFDFIIWMCAGAFLAVLLLACADLAAIQFGQVFRRQREVAIRMAVGAPRGRILRFLLTESLLLALLAGILSLPVTAGAIAAFHAAGDRWGLHRLAGWSAIGFDGLAASTAFTLSLASGALAGFLPAWRFARRDPWPMLHPAAPAPAALRSGTPLGRLRLALLSAQLALAVPILFLAIAFTVEGNRRLASPTVHAFDSTWRLGLALGGDRPNPAALLEKLTQRLEQQGHSTIVTSVVPFGDDPDPLEYEAGGARHTTQLARVNARFFEIPGVHWLKGGPWTEEEGRWRGTVPVVVSQELARQAGTVGTSIVLLNGNGLRVPAEIVGIAGLPALDMYQMWTGSTIFLPYQRGPLKTANLLVEGDRAEIEAIVHEVDAKLDPSIQSYASRIRENARFWWSMVGGLWSAGLLTLALALTGVTAYLTQVFSERDHEVALRCALGGWIREIWVWITRQVSPALATGTAIAAVLGAGALLARSGLSPSPGLALWGAGAVAIGVLWAVWSGASWVASARAAAESLMDRLRHS